MTVPVRNNLQNQIPGLYTHLPIIVGTCETRINTSVVIIIVVVVVVVVGIQEDGGAAVLGLLTRDATEDGDQGFQHHIDPGLRPDPRGRVQKVIQ